MNTLAWAYGCLILLALAIGACVAHGLRRGARRGWRAELDEQSRSIFDEHEPEGSPTDFFPGKGPPPSEYLM